VIPRGGRLPAVGYVVGSAYYVAVAQSRERSSRCQPEGNQMVYNWLNLGQLPFSPRCLLCTAACPPSRDLCYACLEDLPRPGPACPCCGASLKGPGLCGRCQRHPPAYHTTFAAFSYAPPLDRLIQGLKFHGQLHYARVLGELLAQALTERDLPRPDHLVPVPLHSRRLRRRGYNQALEIARPVSRHLGIPLEIHGIRRVQATPPQTGLSESQRRRNLRHAFRVHAPLEANRVALVDDVMTTGHTVNELARCLKRAGVETVDVWVVARA
jgi:ComF family protein